MDEYLKELTDEAEVRVAGLHVDDDRTKFNVSVHLRGITYRKTGHGTVWQSVHVHLNDWQVHEVAVGDCPTLRTILSLHLAKQEQVAWLLGMVEGFLAASSRRS